eukprot:TRINITY_DN741_c0_g1_i2.p1 TRINITY_DN741_c0_g1~~TRINITY_DN741_c0_g1_i2.p1  ORF type:complete len:212 (+),score=33.78 TRINITY_DN741_c0_g1_i2:62-697(+)
MNVKRYNTLEMDYTEGWQMAKTLLLDFPFDTPMYSFALTDLRSYFSWLFWRGNTTIKSKQRIYQNLKELVEFYLEREKNNLMETLFLNSEVHSVERNSSEISSWVTRAVKFLEIIHVVTSSTEKLYIPLMKRADPAFITLKTHSLSLMNTNLQFLFMEISWFYCWLLFLGISVPLSRDTWIEISRKLCLLIRFEILRDFTDRGLDFIECWK